MKACVPSIVLLRMICIITNISLVIQWFSQQTIVVLTAQLLTYIISNTAHVPLYCMSLTSSVPLDEDDNHTVHLSVYNVMNTWLYMHVCLSHVLYKQYFYIASCHFARVRCSGWIQSKFRPTTSRYCDIETTLFLNMFEVMLIELTLFGLNVHFPSSMCSAKSANYIFARPLMRVGFGPVSLWSSV